MVYFKKAEFWHRTGTAGVSRRRPGRGPRLLAYRAGAWLTQYERGMTKAEVGLVFVTALLWLAVVVAFVLLFIVK